MSFDRNTSNCFINLLRTEPDILLKILSELSYEDILYLGRTSLIIHNLFLQCGVWDDLIQRWSIRSKLGPNCYDWSRRVVTEYQFEVLDRLERLTSRFSRGPTSSRTLSVCEAVRDVRMSEARLSFLLESGRVKTFSRQDLSEIPPTFQTPLDQINIRRVSLHTSHLSIICVFSERLLAGVERGADRLLHVWSLHTGQLILSSEDYRECQVDMLITVSDRRHDYLIVYFNIYEPRHRLHVFKVL